MYETIISVPELNTLLESGEDIAVVDCRFSLADHRWGYKEYLTAHLPGARYAHLNADLSSPVVAGVTGRHPLPDPEQFAAWLGKAGITRDTQVIAYDQSHGAMAARLWWLLRWMGHEAVAVLDGGWAAWKRAGLPVTMEVPAPATTVFEVELHPELIASIEDVRAWACDGKHTVVDARESHRYAGLEEPIDPVAGHIPGAVNFPFAENTYPDGAWKPAEMLRARFAQLLEGRNCSDIVFYCGSGVTAAHDILAFRHAGLGMARLYPGSWSEWITDPARGVEISV